MNLGNRCQFAAECPIFQGEEETKIELSLFRNVFCNRGYKGWKNCDRYLELTKQKENNEKNY
ncbi:hypothetical protein [Maribellus mangrovi]|uniref:hypothetical protein n=1 Tax=Maribellus mangrovi TaxID=3133146 RepID=UPI0030ECA27A